MKELKHKSFKNKELKKIEILIEKNILSSRFLLQLIKGIKSDIGQVKIKNKNDLLQYCYFVAGTVGIMMCNIFNIYNKNAYYYAVNLGIAMQLTNIARDIVEDSKLKRIYIPQSWFLIKYDQLIRIKKKQKKILELSTKKILNLSEDYYKSAILGMGYIPLRSRFAILIASQIYRQIGIKILKNNYSNLEKRETVNLVEKIICVFKCIIIFIFFFPMHKKNNSYSGKLQSNTIKNKYT